MKVSTFILIFIISIFLISIVSAADSLNDLTDQINDVENGLGSIPTSQEDAKTAASEYLKKEWKVILMKQPVIGPIVTFYNSTTPVTDPASKAVFGTKQEFSWRFTLILVFWVFFFIMFYRILSGFSTFSKGTSMAITFGLILILAQFQFFFYLSSLVIKLCSLLGKWWFQLIAVLALYVGLYALAQTSKGLENSLRDWREKVRKMKEEERLMIMEAKQKADDAVREELGKALDD